MPYIIKFRTAGIGGKWPIFNDFRGAAVLWRGRVDDLERVRRLRQ